ncbi:MAG: membrane protein insertion efficiency factor YidD [Planctomycetota bacterium]|nr:MAG: membrane protein insertion efficiency factor YidD [Planctomycetota bacterium]
MKRLVGAAAVLWRHTLGAIIPDACRFTPSCSHYAAEAVSRRGLFRGGALTLWRLLRCQPLCKGGHDPVVKSRPPCRRA